MGVDVEIWVLGTCTDEELAVAEAFMMNRVGDMAWRGEPILERREWETPRIEIKDQASVSTASTTSVVIGRESMVASERCKQHFLVERSTTGATVVASGAENVRQSFLKASGNGGWVRTVMATANDLGPTTQGIVPS